MRLSACTRQLVSRGSVASQAKGLERRKFWRQGVFVFAFEVLLCGITRRDGSKRVVVSAWATAETKFRQPGSCIFCVLIMRFLMFIVVISAVR